MKSTGANSYTSHTLTHLIYTQSQTQTHTHTKMLRCLLKHRIPLFFSVWSFVAVLHYIYIYINILWFFFLGQFFLCFWRIYFKMRLIYLFTVGDSQLQPVLLCSLMGGVLGNSLFDLQPLSCSKLYCHPLFQTSSFNSFFFSCFPSTWVLLRMSPSSHSYLAHCRTSLLRVVFLSHASAW